MRAVVDDVQLLIPLLNRMLPTRFCLEMKGSEIITMLDNENLASFDLSLFEIDPENIAAVLDVFLSGLQDQVSEHTGQWWPSGRGGFPNLTVRLSSGKIQLLLDHAASGESTP